LFNGLDEFIRCDIEFDVARLAGPERADVGDRGCVGVGEFQAGEFYMLLGRFQRTGHRGGRRAGASSDDGEVKIGRVAVFAEVNKTERSPALEGQASSVLGIHAM